MLCMCRGAKAYTLKRYLELAAALQAKARALSTSGAAPPQAFPHRAALASACIWHRAGGEVADRPRCFRQAARACTVHVSLRTQGA